MFASLPNFADKNFIIGFYLPALLALLVASWIVFPQADSFAVLGSGDLGKFAYLLSGAFILAIVLMTTNHLQYRVLEGYLPPLSWLGGARERRKFDRLNDRYQKLTEERNRARAEHRDFSPEMAAERSNLRLELLQRFPTSTGEMLPTRFGNTIRAFEVYPREIYGVDGVTMFLRLGAVVPEHFAGILDDARSQVDCFVNVTWLAAALGALALVEAIPPATFALTSISQLARVLSSFDAVSARDTLIAAACIATALICYRWATIRAVAWGELVKSTFDCFLPDLAKQLGYKLPESDADRKTFWREINRLIIYQVPMTPDKWKLA